MNPPVRKNEIETDHKIMSRIQTLEEIMTTDGQMTVHQIDSTMNLTLTIKQSLMTKTIELSRYVTTPSNDARKPNPNIIALNGHLKPATLYTDPSYSWSQQANSIDNNNSNANMALIRTFTSEHYGSNHQLPIVEAKIGNWKGKVLLDTGATRSIIAEEITRQIGAPMFQNTNYTASGVNGRVNMRHQIQAPITLLEKTFGPFNLLVLKDVPTFRDTAFDALIGCDVLSHVPNLIFNLSTGVVSFGAPENKLSANNAHAFFLCQQEKDQPISYGFWQAEQPPNEGNTIICPNLWIPETTVETTTACVDESNQTRNETLSNQIQNEQADLIDLKDIILEQTKCPELSQAIEILKGTSNTPTGDLNTKRITNFMQMANS